MKLFRSAVAIWFVVSTLTAWSLAATRPPDVTITLKPSVTSPQYLGTSIRWTATVQNGKQGHSYDYRFSVTYQGQEQITKDFQTHNSFVWVPYSVEGTYQVKVTVRDVTGISKIVYPPVSVAYVINPWVTAPGGSAVHATSHPLVALFSGPPCQSGHTLQVRFQQTGSNVSTATNSVPCSDKSANFYVAGMLPSTQYMMHWEEIGPTFFSKGAELSFTTGPLPANYPATHFKVNVPPTQHDLAFPVVLFQFINSPQQHWPSATDLSGNVIWYFPGPQHINRIEAGGEVFGFPDDLTFADYDLAGNLVLQTTIPRLNEQLVAQGYPMINDFNMHETRRLSNGNLLMIASRDMVSTKYQGGTEEHPVDILGDVILILDHNMQLVWAWDSFAHEDLSRKATMNDSCTHGSGCPRFNLNFDTANDWLHTNSVQLTRDGDLLVSQRSQDFVIKVNYKNGQGDGSIIWRMGPYGDFTISNPPQNGCGNPDVFPWFTHQHDAAFQIAARGSQLGQSVMTVFDNGDLRNLQCGGGQNSRGMMMLVNEGNHTITYQILADLGGMSGAWGSGDILLTSDGLYASYGNGGVGNQAARSTEVNLDSKIVYELEVDSWSYRIYRRRDLYTPTLP